MLILLVLLLQAASNEASQAKITSELWELEASRTGTRWLVIHNLAQAEKDGLYHVEVLERKHGDPAWKFERLAAHLAVTKKALLKSVRRPLPTGHVYPEHFNEALQAWQKLKEEGRAPICSLDILSCLDLFEK